VTAHDVTGLDDRALGAVLALGEIRHADGRPMSPGARWTELLIVRFTQHGKRSCVEPKETFAAALGCCSKVAGRYQRELVTLGRIEIKKHRGGNRPDEIILLPSAAHGDALDRNIVPARDSTGGKPPVLKRQRSAADRRTIEAALAVPVTNERVCAFLVEHGPADPELVAEGVGLPVRAVWLSIKDMQRYGWLRESDEGFEAVPGALEEARQVLRRSLPRSRSSGDGDGGSRDGGPSDNGSHDVRQETVGLGAVGASPGVEQVRGDETPPPPGGRLDALSPDDGRRSAADEARLLTVDVAAATPSGNEGSNGCDDGEAAAEAPSPAPSDARTKSSPCSVFSISAGKCWVRFSERGFADRSRVRGGARRSRARGAG